MKRVEQLAAASWEYKPAGEGCEVGRLSDSSGMELAHLFGDLASCANLDPQAVGRALAEVPNMLKAMRQVSIILDSARSYWREAAVLRKEVRGIMARIEGVEG